MLGKSSTSNDTIPYEGMWIRADGSCQLYQNKRDVSCSSTGNLQFFQNDGCTGQSSSYSLSLNPLASFNSTRGEFTASLVKETGELEPYEWIMNLPTSEIFPRLSEPFDVIQLSLYAASMISFLWIFYFQVMLVLKRRTLYLLTLCLSSLLWISWLTVRIWLTFSYFSVIWDGSVRSLRNLASLSSVWLALSFTMKFLNIKRIKRYICFTMLLVIHFGLTGYDYLRFFRESEWYQKAEWIRFGQQNLSYYVRLPKITTVAYFHVCL